MRCDKEESLSFCKQLILISVYQWLFFKDIDSHYNLGFDEIFDLDWISDLDFRWICLWICFGHFMNVLVHSFKGEEQA